MKKVLMIAFHYPPSSESSGLLRTLAFSRYLPKHDWQPIVLTASSRAHTRLDDGLVASIPSQVPVERAFALDAARHLSIRGRYLKATTLPDRWASWWLGAVPAGLRLIRKHEPQAIWSTFPIPTAHLIGLTLHRLTGLPWVADYRDPMAQDDYPSDPLTRRVFHAIDRRVVNHCTAAVFTTPGASLSYASRYPHIPATRWSVIPNGYEAKQLAFVDTIDNTRKNDSGRIVLLHSGLIYPSERDPSALFGALADLKREDAVSPSSFSLVLRATGHDDHHRRLLEEHGVEDLVSLEPRIPYRQALMEMLDANGLLILQASNCNAQIPAKLYEYLRVRRPIFALTDPHGDTAATLREAGIDTIVPLDSRAEIVSGLRTFLTRLRDGTAPLASDDEIARHTRESRARDLARLLDTVAETGSRQS